MALLLPIIMIGNSHEAFEGADTSTYRFGLVHLATDSDISNFGYEAESDFVLRDNVGPELPSGDFFMKELRPVSDKTSQQGYQSDEFVDFGQLFAIDPIQANLALAELAMSDEKDCRGCHYRVINSKRCRTSYSDRIYIQEARPTNFTQLRGEAWFIKFDDGTAKYIETASNGTDTVTLTIYLSGHTTSPPYGSPKKPDWLTEKLCGWPDYNSFHYYPNLSGTLVSSRYGKHTISRRGPAFQIGQGGDPSRPGVYGGSAWYNIHPSEGQYSPYRVGDINFQADPNCTRLTPPTAEAGPDQEICEGESATLTATGGGTYLWMPGGATTASITVSPSTTTTYTVTVTNRFGCTDTDTVTVTVNDDLDVDAGPDVEICEGEEVTLTASADDAESYRWSPGGETTRSITVSPTRTTTYTVRVESEAGCEGEDSVTVTVNDRVRIGDFVWVDLDGDGRQDAGESGVEGVTVELFLCNNGRNSGGEFVDDAVTDEDGEYFFEVCPGDEYYIEFSDIPDGYEFTDQDATTDTRDSDADEDGVTDCFEVGNRDDLTIDAGLIPPCDIDPEIDNPGPICEGEEITLTASGGNQYQWRTGGRDIPGETNATLTVSPTETTVYSVVVTDTTQSENCTAMVQTTVVVREGPDADAGPDVTICDDESATLTASGGGTYLWMPGRETSQSITVRPDVTTTYTVTVTDENGCTDTDSVVVSVEDPITIGDFVFVDEDEDGRQDSGEPGRANVTVTLFRCNGNTNAGGVEVESTTTDEDGRYEFEVCPNSGDYYIEFDIPDGFEATTMNAGSNDFIDSDINQNGVTDCFNVGDEDDPSRDAGIVERDCPIDPDIENPGPVCEGTEVTLRVTADTTGNTYQWSDEDGEINGATNATLTVTPTETTTYTVVVTNAAAGCSESASVTVTVEDRVRIGDLVFNDRNENGIQDPGEEGVPNIEVVLFVCNDNGEPGGGTRYMTTTTNNDGEYGFDVCPDSGQYYIEFGELPEGFTFTGQDQGNNDAIDSDADANGQTDCFTVEDEDNPTIDAGITRGDCPINPDINDPSPVCEGDSVTLTVTAETDNNTYQWFADDAIIPGATGNSITVTPTETTRYHVVVRNEEFDCEERAYQTVTVEQRVRIGDFVFNDEDGDGIQDAGEEGIAGVDVTLFECNDSGQPGGGTRVMTVTTDANGNYFFNVCPSDGPFYIEFERPDNMEFTDQDQGNNDAVDSDVNSAGQTDCFEVDDEDLTIDAGLVDEDCPINPEIEGPTTVCSGEDLTLTANAETNNNTYRWFANGIVIAGETSATLTVNPTENTTYRVEVTNADENCTEDDSIVVTVEDRIRIGNFVFNDQNQNGIQDRGEDGVEDVRVRLFRCNDGEPVGGEIVDTAMTDENGMYFFNVCPDSGMYYLDFDQLPTEEGVNYVFTDQDAGNNDSLDSDADSNGITDCFEVGDNDDLTRDAGIHRDDDCMLMVDITPSSPEICEGDRIELTANVTGAVGNVTYQWQADGQDIPGETNATLTVSPTEDTEYTVSAYDDGVEDCHDEDTVTVTVNPLPNANAGPDQTICGDETATLTATGGGTYRWAPGGETTASITVSPDVTTTYTVTVTSEDGCVDTDSVVVNVEDEVRIGDLVFNDLDGDGIQDAGEPGVAGVEVTLFLCNDDGEPGGGTEVRTVTTDANGNYFFDVCPDSGPYYIEFEAPAGAEFTDQDQGNNDAVDSDVNSDGQTDCFEVDDEDLTIDAGLVIDCPINPEIDNPSPVCSGESVTLEVETDTTGNTYQWFADDEELDGETGPTLTVSPTETTRYHVVVTNEEEGCMERAYVTVTVEERVRIGNFVFEDEDADGIQDTGEPGVEGVRVRLFRCNDGNNVGGDLVDTAITNDNGMYSFDVCPDSGEYYIEFDQLADGFRFTEQDAGNNDAIDSDPDSNGVTDCFTVEDEDDLTRDAGIVNDVDCPINPEIEDPSPVCAGEEITLEVTTDNDAADNTYQWSANGVEIAGATNPTLTVTPTATTVYSVVVTNEEADCSQMASVRVEVAPRVRVGNFVFDDRNSNGIQDAGEPGIGNVRVRIFECNDGNNTGGDIFDTTMTDLNGLYEFEVCPNREYYIEFDQIPDGFDFTDQDQGTNDAIDSDADANGRTDCFMVEDENDLTRDAGLVDDCPINPLIEDPSPVCVNTEITLEVDTDTTGNTYQWSANGQTLPGETGSTLTVTPTANTTYSVLVTNSEAGCSATATVDVTVEARVSVGDFVWDDANGNGIQDPDEDGIEGVEVELFLCNDDGIPGGGTSVGTVVTGPDGRYSFDVCPNTGPYYIEFERPDGTRFTTPNAGTNDNVDSDADANGRTDCFNVEEEPINNIDAGLVDDCNINAVITPSNPEVCAGMSITLDASGSTNADRFQWAANGVDIPGETNAMLTVTPTVDTRYTVSVYDDDVEDCHDEASVTVEVNPLPNANAGPDQTICGDENATLTATGGGTYLWMPGGQTTASITVSPDETTTYTVTVTSADGCTDTDSVVVTVEDEIRIGDFVWNDQNGNGIQDPGEPGVNGVTVMLFRCNNGMNTGGTIEDTTTTGRNPETGEDGYYSFEVCPGDEYYLRFSNIPDGFEFTEQDAGSNGAVDSDADENGVTDCFEFNMDNLTIDAGLRDECDIRIQLERTADNICPGETVEITVNIEDSADCDEGCDYPVLEQDRCAGPTGDFTFWLENRDRNFNLSRFTASEESFETFDNGDARYTGTLSNGVDNITVVINHTGFTTTAPPGSPNPNTCMSFDTSEWVYWLNTTGTIVSEQHGTFNLVRTGPAFQLGVGADVRRTGFGASGWFNVTGGDGFYNFGDLNIPLGFCIPKGYDVRWTTADGNIVGPSNALTITVDEPGTYEVEVVNCIDCDVADSITIGECNRGSREFAATRPEASISGMFPVPAQCGGQLTVMLDGSDSHSSDNDGATNLSVSTRPGPVYTQTVTATLYDMNGKMVQAPQSFSMSSDAMVINMNIDFLPPGSYIVNVAGDGWNESKQVLIK